MKIRNNGEREGDVVWVFSGFMTFIGCILILETLGILVFTGLIHWRPPMPFFIVIVIAFVAGSMYLNHRIFLSNDRFKAILKEYGPQPRRKDIWVGLVAFMIGTCIIFIWASLKIIVWEALHKK